MEVGTFNAPGPGAWEIESAHMQRPLTRWMQAVFPQNMMRGFKDATARYGALLSHLEIGVVNGFMYVCPRPVGAPPGAKGPPPKLIFKLLTKLHPEIRRRIKRTADVFETKAWRADVARWDNEVKPRIEKRHAELYAVDPAQLDTEGLCKHLLDVEERMGDALFNHHALNMCALLPPGDFIAHVTQWTGADRQTLCALLAGCSHVSVGATDELARAVEAIRANAQASQILSGTGSSAEIVAALRGFAGEVGVAVRAYIDAIGPRTPAGYDICEPSAVELPDIFVGALRAGPKPALDRAAIERATAKVRDAVPEQHRARFDELLGEARFVYRIRDERGYLNDAFAVGLVRRALLEAGRRLVAAGKLAQADHVVDLAPTEVHAMLRGQAGPSAAEVAAHVAYRTTHSVTDAPAKLGLLPSPPPPAEWLPPAAARMMRAVNAMMSGMFDVRAKQKTEPKLLRGVGASAGTYEGRARVVLGADQFGKVERGDVLIARTTCPSYNVLLPLLGGIVTDRGGVLSHAAIVAREYGLPAIVGTTDATTQVPDGARVRIDGASGDIHVLS